MTVLDLTDAQAHLADRAGSLFAEACPGAGKTKSIVRRFVQRTTQEPRKGIGLLSFTNAAIDEVKTRCGDHTRSLVVPNFVGTFDSFVNRFIVTPLYIRDYHQLPTFVETWDATAGSTVRLKNTNSDRDRANYGYDLEWFTFDVDGGASLVDERISGPYAKGLRKFAAINRPQLCQKASSLWQWLVKRGLISSSAARTLACRWLSNQADRKLIGSLLAARFAEVIVDEAQDCGVEELAVLSMLRAYGVDLVMVADLDQSIYEFRRAVPDAVRQFAAQLPSVPRLDGNFRSTPAICRLIAGLRTSRVPDIPLGRHAASSTPVHLLPFADLHDLPPVVRDITGQQGFHTDQIMVLAYKTSDARAAAGGQRQQVSSVNRVVRIAASAQVVNDPRADNQARHRACDDLERALLHFIKTDADNRGIEATCQEIGLPRRWLRDTAIRVGVHLGDPGNQTAGEYTTQLREKLRSLPWPISVEFGQLRSPKDPEWRALRRQSLDVLRWSTIHGAKGRQFPVVTLIIPENLKQDRNGRTALDHWDNRSSAESKRVLYVGVSRAEELLLLAVHKAHLERVQGLLSQHSVPYL